MPGAVFAGSIAGNYMSSANCLASDFFHPRFAEFCVAYKHRVQLHRKLWEWAFIYHHLNDAGVLADGKRGLGFGVGQERLPAFFASKGATVVATDAPSGVADSGWKETGQHSDALEDLFHRDLVEEDEFRSHVTFEPADMNNISPHLTDFDFCWSACCFEHLGSIQHGLDFVCNSIKSIRPGGIAVHTTELNLSSDDETVETGGTVLFRRRDFDALKSRLRQDGHIVKDLPIKLGLSYIDHLVDVPPYRDEPHLKTALGRFVMTSAGIVIRRGDEQ